MENINRVPSKIIEMEISIKLLEYLKRKSTVDDKMYNYCINKLIEKLGLEKLKQDDSLKNIDSYKILS